MPEREVAISSKIMFRIGDIHVLHTHLPHFMHVATDKLKLPKKIGRSYIDGTSAHEP